MADLFIYLGELAVGACIFGWLARALIRGVRSLFFGLSDV